jgi:hypothetical protein
LPRLHGLRFDERGLGGADVRFRGAQPILIVLRVNGGERLAFRDRGSDVHQASKHLAGNTE